MLRVFGQTKSELQARATNARSAADVTQGGSCLSVLGVLCPLRLALRYVFSGRSDYYCTHNPRPFPKKLETFWQTRNSAGCTRRVPCPHGIETESL